MVKPNTNMESRVEAVETGEGSLRESCNGGGHTPITAKELRCHGEHVGRKSRCGGKKVEFGGGSDVKASISVEEAISGIRSSRKGSAWGKSVENARNADIRRRGSEWVGDQNRKVFSIASCAGRR